jgi:LuxR family maltose regulon positive regulatory protein
MPTQPDLFCGQAGHLAICLFSSFEAHLDGESVNSRLGGKARQLLKILAAHVKRPLSKDALIDLLWPGADSVSGATSLKVTAHKLRHALDPDRSSGNHIIVENGTYRLNPELTIWIDTEAFRELYQRGRSLESEARTAEALECLRKAEALYRGDYLEEDMYEDWPVIRREELRDLYLDTLHRLAQLALSENAHTDVIQYCHKIVLADPCREDAYRMLMSSHATLNQYSRAGAWYAVCRTTLQREINSEPSIETMNAFERLFDPNRFIDRMEESV